LLQQITHIVKLSKGTKKYGIYVDGKFISFVHEDNLIKFNLYKGLFVDSKEIQMWIEAEEANQMRQAVLCYLKYPRTIYEVKKYLARKGGSTRLHELIVAEMINRGYLNDCNYAKAWVEKKRRNKKWGYLRLKSELKKKGIEVKWIEEALEAIDENKDYQLAMEIAKRFYIRIDMQSWPKMKSKIGNNLLRKGYSLETVLQVLDACRLHYKEREVDL
jgi:regulatory protein